MTSYTTNKLIQLLLLYTLFTFVFGSKFLPKKLDYLPMNTLYAKNMARSGTSTFWKTATDGGDGNYRGTIISSYPVRPNAVTKVTVNMEVGNQFHIAVGQKSIPMMLEKGDTYFYPNTVSYWTKGGTKCVDKNQSPYAARAYQGDNITMTIDLRPYKGWVSYAKNGQNLGIAFSGLEDWGTDIYIMFSFFINNFRLKIVDYCVIE